MSAIIESWMHSPDHPELRAFALGQSRIMTKRICSDEVELDWVHPADGCKSIDLLACYDIGPHVDNYHAAWSALWVLQCGVGHSLHISDRKARNFSRPRKPAKRATEVAPLTVGMVVIFNAHRVHWLPPAVDGTLLVVANFDFETRPDRASVDDLIIQAARSLNLRAAA